MWSVGCIFAELMLRTPFLAGETDIGQLKVIFSALGTPNEEEWPGLTSLPDYYEFEKCARTPLKSIFTAASPTALDLLEKMLMYDPLKRPSCQGALDHPYFHTQPRPTRPERLPRPDQKMSLADGKTGKKRKAGMDDSVSIDPEMRKVARKLF
jgi:cyclin-dependent kinase 7